MLVSCPVRLYACLSLKVSVLRGTLAGIRGKPDEGGEDKGEYRKAKAGNGLQGDGSRNRILGGREYEDESGKKRMGRREWENESMRTRA